MWVCLLCECLQSHIDRKKTACATSTLALFLFYFSHLCLFYGHNSSISMLVPCNISCYSLWFAFHLLGFQQLINLFRTQRGCVRLKWYSRLKISQTVSSYFCVLIVIKICRADYTSLSLPVKVVPLLLKLKFISRKLMSLSKSKMSF